VNPRFRCLVLLATLASSLACDKPHVLVVGLDGSNWAVLRPLIESGALPNIGRLVNEGARAGLLCAPAHEQTACFCPPVWTSIATGHRYVDHRIGGLYTQSNQRGTKALWNVVGQYGGVATTVSYRGTWPPESDVDFVFTEPGLDEQGEAHFDVWQAIDHPGRNHAFPLFRPSNILDGIGLEAPEEPGPPLWAIYARDRMAMQSLLRLEIARGWAEPWERRTELAMIILHGPDKVAHVAWGLLQDYMYGPVRSAPLLAEVEQWNGPVHLPGPYGWGPISGPYLEADAWLGELLAAHPYDYVVLVSDHGMTRSVEPGLSGQHDRFLPEAHVGIFAVHGPGVRSGAWLGMVSVLDVAPTVAYLLDLPIAEDLPGRVLSEAFEPSWLRIRPAYADTVPTWE